MKRIKDNSEIKVGDVIVFEELKQDCFNAKKTTVTITELDSDGDFWCQPKDSQLSTGYKGYEDICLGNTEDRDCNFYKK